MKRTTVKRRIISLIIIISRDDASDISSFTNASEVRIERALSQETGTTSLDVLGENREGTEDDVFSSARSSFASKNELFGSDLDLPDISYDILQDSVEQPHKLERVSSLSSVRPSWASTLRYASNPSCYIEFCELKEESGNASAPDVTFHFAIACDERCSFFGWFYSLNPISGYGYCFNKEGTYYAGELKNGKKSGYGVFFYGNGSHYNGYWECNQKHGDGRFYFNDDLYYSGRWNSNKMVECKLEYNTSVYPDINGIFSYISTHNDFIFFKQYQLCT